MAFSVSNLIPTASSAASTGISLIWYVVLGVGVLILLSVIFVLWYFRKRWNLTVIFELTRNDAKLTNCEIGKGFYDSKRGVVYVRRPTMGKFSKGIAIKIFDIRRYLQSGDILHVVQVGPEDFRPVLVDSWTEHVQSYTDSKTGIVQEIIRIKCSKNL